MSHLSNFDSNYDIWLEHSSKKIGYKLAHDDKGNPMITESIATFVAPQISQGSYSYDSTAAEVNVPVAYEDWQGGCGFVFAPSNSTLAKVCYAYASGIDASWPNRLFVAPAKQTGGSTTQAPIKFVYSSFGTHVMTTRYVMEWTGAAWTTRLDNTNKTNTDLVEYKNSRGTYLVLTQSDDNYYISTDGVTFSQPNSGSIAPTFRSSSSSSAVTTQQTTITKPANVAVDDVMFAVIMTFGSTSFTGVPSGWTLIGSRTTEIVDAYFYWKRVTTTEPATYTWYMSGFTMGGSIVAYQGCATTGNPYDSDAYNAASASGTTHTTGSQICIGDNRTYLVLVASGDNTAESAVTWTPAAGFTERVDSYYVGGSVTLTVGAFDKSVTVGSIAASAPTVSRTLTNFFGYEFCLRPETGAGALNNGMRLAVRGSADGEPLLWCVDSNGGIRNTPDPTHPGLWSNADTIQFSQPVTISGLEVLDNVFYLYHSKGIDSYDGTTVATVWNNTSLTLESDAARPYTWGDQRTYFTYNGALYRFDSGKTFIEKIWPHTLQQEEDIRSGTITSITGDSRNLYFTLKNLAGNYILMKCDPYRIYDVGGTSLMPAFDINEFSTNACGAMIVVPGASDTLHTTNPQLVYGYGTNANYLILTRNGALPSDDSNYRFDTGTGTIIGAYNNAGARLFPKFANSGTFIAASADANTTGVLSVDTLSLTGASVTTSVATGTTSSGPISGNITSDIQFSDIRYNLTMDSNTNTTPYQVRGIVINTSLNPTRMRMWNITVEIAEELERIGGGDSSYGAHYLADHLFNGLTQRVTYYDRGGTSYVTRILDVKGQHVGRDKIVYNVVLVQLY